MSFKIFLPLLVLFSSYLQAYEDEELIALFSSLSDIHHPTLQDYRLIENYLKYGRRPYLNSLLENELKNLCENRLQSIFNINLIGENQEMPVLEFHELRIREETKKRCIVLFSSYNGMYPKKARTLLAELKNCGYSGNVLLRIGGYPNTPYGGLKLCHVPYSFKALALREALLLGFKEVLWLDSALHPLTNLEQIFSEIKEKGYFFSYVGALQENGRFHLAEAAHSLGITRDLYKEIPHISSSCIGLNLENSKAVDLLDVWLEEIAKVYPNITWFPEELSLSAVAWRLNCNPSLWFGTIAFPEERIFEVQFNGLSLEKNYQFYLDSVR